MSNPFILDVRPVLRGTTGSPEAVTLTGPAPHDLGGELLAIHKDAPVRVEATLTNLGGAIMVDADIHGTATGSCARCLNPLNPDLDFSIQEVFALNEDTVQGDEAHSEEEVVATVDEEDRVRRMYGLGGGFLGSSEAGDVDSGGGTPSAANSSTSRGGGRSTMASSS